MSSVGVTPVARGGERRGGIVWASWFEPLLACAPGRRWQVRWSSEDVAYGGNGVVDPCAETGWWLPAESATLLASVDAGGREP